jgi:NADPH-dependent curcumin reductase CurA
MHRLEQALADLAAWLRDGRLRYREDVAEGLDKAPEALLRLLAGGNSGKMLVRVGPEPS